METDTGSCSVYFTLIYLDDFVIMPAWNTCCGAWWRVLLLESVQLSLISSSSGKSWEGRVRMSSIEVYRRLSDV
jgi:hypothetical protein